MSKLLCPENKSEIQGFFAALGMATSKGFAPSRKLRQASLG
jgi:hypothetical protein